MLIGGTRSGKTRRALALADEKRWRVYVATAEALDDEMQQRIDRHRRERGDGWTTVEAPLGLPSAILRLGSDIGAARRSGDTAIVVDCLTLWLSNLMHAGRDFTVETDALIEALSTCPAPVILVTNEVGQGVVPANKLAREFRDAQGRLNQTVAAAVGRVEMVVAGLSMRLK